MGWSLPSFPYLGLCIHTGTQPQTAATVSEPGWVPALPLASCVPCPVQVLHLLACEVERVLTLISQGLGEGGKALRYGKCLHSVWVYTAGAQHSATMAIIKGPAPKQASSVGPCLLSSESLFISSPKELHCGQQSFPVHSAFPKARHLDYLGHGQNSCSIMMSKNA